MVTKSVEEVGGGSSKTQRNFYPSVTILFDSVLNQCYQGVVEPLGGKA